MSHFEFLESQLEIKNWLFLIKYKNCLIEFAWFNVVVYELLIDTHKELQAGLRG